MTLDEAYRAHFIDGGAYYRLAWNPNTYLRILCRPEYLNNYVWQGNRIYLPEQRYVTYNIYQYTEDNETDWNWVDQFFMMNATILQQQKATNTEDTIEVAHPDPAVPSNEQGDS